jgi:hypothetical protein
MARQIAVVGLSPSSHDDAPWGDDDWEIWGLPWDSMWEFIDVHFEMHPLELLKEPKAYRPDGYIDRLNSLSTLYMQREYTDVPNAMSYPLGTVINSLGMDYFNSSISYVLGMAIHWIRAYRYKGGPLYESKIGIWGVDMANITAPDPNDPSYKTEFEYQRPNMEYLIGYARGLGIEVYIPDESPLCKFQGEGIPLGTMYPTYPKRYGYLT